MHRVNCVDDTACKPKLLRKQHFITLSNVKKYDLMSSVHRYFMADYNVEITRHG